MKNVFLLFTFCVFLLILTAQCHADVIDISLDPVDWIVNDAHDWEHYTANYTKQTIQGNLRVTRTVANPGTGWGVHLRTAETFAFTGPDIDYSILRYQWRVNGLGTYCSSHGGPGAPNSSGIYNPWLFGPTGRLTTGWSWDGSIVVDDNAWLFTEVKINADRTWTANTSYGSYGAANPLTSFGGTVDQLYYESLGDMYFRHSLGDDYAAGQYFEIAEATLTIIPEPATLMLLSIGGLVCLKKRI